MEGKKVFVASNGIKVVFMNEPDIEKFERAMIDLYRKVKTRQAKEAKANEPAA